MRKNAFTLIELLVVISIIGTIIGFAFVAFQETKKSARDTQRKADLEDIRSSLEVFKADCKHYKDEPLPTNPSSLVGDGTSTACPTTNNYLFIMPKDPSAGRSYYYDRLTETSYELCAALENTPATSACTDKTCGDVACNYKVKNP